MKTLYDIGEKIYFPYEVEKIIIGKDREPHYELRDGGECFTRSESSMLAKVRTERAVREPYKCIEWVEDGVREPTKDGDYLVTVEDDYGNMGAVIRTVEVCTYYTEDGDGETYAGWQASSRVIAWADIPLEAYNGDYK